MPKLNHRQLPGSFELREMDGSSEGVLVGVVTTYDSPYDIGWGFRESIESGAFDDSLEKQGTIPVFYQHNHRDGSTPIGVARMVPGDSGSLTMRAELFLDDPQAAAVFRAAKAGALREWSVGFYYGDEEAGDLVVNKKEQLLTVRRGDLAEVSIVLRGANPETHTLDVRELVVSSEETPPAASDTDSAEAARLLFDLNL